MTLANLTGTLIEIKKEGTARLIHIYKFQNVMSPAWTAGVPIEVALPADVDQTVCAGNRPGNQKIGGVKHVMWAK